MMFFFTNLILMECLVRFLAFFLLRNKVVLVFLDEKSSQECLVNAWDLSGHQPWSIFLLLYINDLYDDLPVILAIYSKCNYTSVM